MLLPVFNELGRTDLSLPFVPQGRIFVVFFHFKFVCGHPELDVIGRY